MISRKYSAAIGQRKFDRGFAGLGKLVLGGDQRLAQFLHGFRMRGEVHALLADFLARHALQHVVDVVAAQMRVAVGREHLVNVAVGGRDQLENRNVERAAAEIVDGDAAALLLVQAVGQRRGGRLVHQAQDFEARQAPRIARGLALRIVEIRRHGDHGAVHHILKIFLGPTFQLAQNERGNFRRREHAIAQAHANHIFAGRIDAERKNLQLVLHVGGTAPHQAFHRIDRALRIASAGGAARASPTMIEPSASTLTTEGHSGVPYGPGIHFGAAFPLVLVSDQAVGGAEINADGASHVLGLLFLP